VTPPIPCLLDTNAFAWIRDNGLEAASYVGSADLAVSDTVLAELLGPMPPDDPKALRNARLLRDMGAVPVETTPEMLDLARTIISDYAGHQPPPGDDPADALIAAEAILSSRVLVTRNWNTSTTSRGCD
jgi:predicted nucleic acid-binding protein